MKKLILPILVLLTFVSTLVAQPAPEPKPSGIFDVITGTVIDTNVTVFADSRFELRQGAVYEKSSTESFKSSTGGSLNLNSTFGVGGEVITANVDGVVDSAHGYIEVRKDLNNLRITGFAGGGRNIAEGKWYGIAGGRASYQVSNRMFGYYQTGAVVSTESPSVVGWQQVVGVGWTF